MSVINYLLRLQTDPPCERVLLARRIKDVFATVFRQNVRTRFEEVAFSARKIKRLSRDLPGRLWIKANFKHYGSYDRRAKGSPLSFEIKAAIHLKALRKLI